MNKKLAEYQKIQADERALGREKQLMKEMEEAEQIRKALENDDKMINTYAKRCLDEWSSQVRAYDPRARMLPLCS